MDESFHIDGPVLERFQRYLYVLACTHIDSWLLPHLHKVATLAGGYSVTISADGNLLATRGKESYGDPSLLESKSHSVRLWNLAVPPGGSPVEINTTSKIYCADRCRPVFSPADNAA